MRRNHRHIFNGSHKTLTYRKYDIINYDKFLADVVSAPCDQIDFDHSSTDHCVDTFNSIFLNLVMLMHLKSLDV